MMPARVPSPKALNIGTLARSLQIRLQALISQGMLAPPLKRDPLGCLLGVTFSQMTIGLADQYSTVTMADPTRDSHEVNSSHDRVRDEKVPTVMESKALYLGTRERFPQGFLEGL